MSCYFARVWLAVWWMCSSTFSGYTNAIMCQLCFVIWLLKAFPLHSLLQGVRDLFVDYLVLSHFFPSRSYSTFFYPNTVIFFFSPLSCDASFSFFKCYLQIAIFLTFQIIGVTEKPSLLSSAILQLCKNK